MSSSSGSRSAPALPIPAFETVRLYSVVGREELEIIRTSDSSLMITKKIYHEENGNLVRDIERPDLTRESVILWYTIANNTDLTRLWHVDIVYRRGGSARETIEYQLLSSRDAFTPQRLVTGYSPYKRFKNVFASALKQHMLRQATELEVVGEAQLWWIPSPESEDEPTLGLNTSQTGSSVGSRPRSIISYATSTRTSTTQIQRDLQGREMVVTTTRPPPLLVFFAKEAARDGKKPAKETYKIMRVESKLTPLSSLLQPVWLIPDAKSPT